MQRSFRIFANLKICICCSLVFLTHQVDGDSRVGNDVSISNFEKKCLCDHLKSRVDTKEVTELTWTEALTELARGYYVLGTESTVSNSLELNTTSRDNFYFKILCSSANFTDCEKIEKFKSPDVCNLSEACKSDLGGRELRVAGVLSEEYAYDTAISQAPDGTSVFEDSFSVELLKCLELTLNFRTIPIVTLYWGHLLPNNSWTGMIALLLSNEADIGISSIADRPFRRAVVDFNIPTNEIRLAAFFQKPSLSSESTALLKPFQTQFWLALAFLSLGMSFTAFAIDAVLTQSNRPDSNKARLDILSINDALSRWSFMDFIQWSVGAICLQGFYKVPSKIPFRIAMLVGSLSGFVVYSAYAGTLVSFLSVVTEPIQNLGHLLSTDFMFVIVNEPLALKFMADSPDSRNVIVYQRRNTERTYSSMKEAYQTVVKGSFVFVTDHIGAYESLTNDFSIQEACLIREIAIDNAGQKQGTLVRKNSPYKRIIDFQILRMIEYGLVRRWNSRYLKIKPACDSQSNYEGVEIASVTIAYLIFGLGILIGTLGLLFERICLRLK